MQTIIVTARSFQKIYSCLYGGCTMSRRGLMSENLKYEIARELGVDNVVQREGWGGVSSRDCGNMVKKAIEMAERNMAQGR